MGLRLVFLYRNGSSVLRMQFLMSEKVVLSFMRSDRELATMNSASLIRDWESLMKTKPRDTITGLASSLFSFESMATITATSPLSARIRRSLRTAVERPEMSFPST